LVDYDNIPDLVRLNGPRYIADRLCAVLSQNAGDRRLDLRLYGGWYAGNSLSTLGQRFLFKQVTFTDCRIHGITVQNDAESFDIYDPSRINRYCEMIGATIKGGSTVSGSSLEEITKTDKELQIIRKLLMLFMRSTQVSDQVLNLRLGVHSSTFRSHIRDELLEVGVLQEVKHTGRGSTHRYRLGKLISTIEEALTACNGSYKRFLDFIRSQT
jgi:hypothetical protein